MALRLGTANNDTIQGGVENDFIFGLAGDDFLQGGAGNDFIGGDNGNDTLIGEAGDDRLIGGAGRDLLSGREGNDNMSGGTGDDTYVVDAIGDIVDERLNEGTDTVVSSLESYTLAANTENLILISNSLNGSGNNLDNDIKGTSRNNTLVGFAGKDTLDGASGNDRMVGGLGNDTYFVDAIGDVVEEKVNEGRDAVFSSLQNYTLRANVEDLTLVGNGLAGLGNNRNNTITGNESNNSLFGADGNDILIGAGGNDVIAGGSGNDTLTGGAGSDLFRYQLETIATSGGNDVDVITDFQSGTDKLVLGGVFSTGFSQQVAIVDDDAAAALSEAQVVYSRTSGSVFFNTNQTEAGFGTGGKFITLQGSALASGDVMFVFEGLIGPSI